MLQCIKKGKPGCITILSVYFLPFRNTVVSKGTSSYFKSINDLILSPSCNSSSFTYTTLAALVALIFSSISTKATRTFSELSWRLYLTAGRSCSSKGWLNLLSKIIGKHCKKKRIMIKKKNIKSGFEKRCGYKLLN